MKILFWAHPQFMLDTDRDQIMNWIDLYSKRLKELGDDVTLFVPEIHKIRDFDVVHLFSPVEPEAISWFRNRNKPVVVTPSLSDTVRVGRVGRLRRIGRLLRAISQRRWPPVDHKLFYQSANHYFMSPSWIKAWILRWDIPKNLISVVPIDDPIQAAMSGHKIYHKIYEGLSQ